MSLIVVSQAPACTKPCRGKDGKIVQCPKPPRKVSLRCKDEKGRFIACQGVIDNGAQSSNRQAVSPSRN